MPAFYASDEGQPGVVVLLVEGRMINLVAEPSASGVRYAWPSGGSGYVWWTKGREAALYWRDAAGEEAALLTQCTAG